MRFTEHTTLSYEHFKFEEKALSSLKNYLLKISYYKYTIL